MNTSNSLSLAVPMKNFSYIVLFVLSATSYLNISAESATILGAFIIFDVITGILKTLFIHGGSAVKSSVLERGVIAKLLLVFVPIGIALAGKAVGVELSSVAQDTINVLVLSELYSIIGNIYAVKTGIDKEEFDAVAYVLGQLKNLLRTLIKDDAPS